jgi:hypothetical protein
VLNVTNRAGSTLAATIDSAVQSLTVASGSLFPASNFIITIDDERILVGTRTGNTFSSLTRGYGSTAASHELGVRVELHIVAEVITELQEHVIALEEGTQTPWPVLTTTQMNALTPTEGSVCWNTTEHQLMVYDGSAWVGIAMTL